MIFLLILYFLTLLLPHFVYLPKIFEKWNLPSYYGYIPFYNWFLCLKKLEKPTYWLVIFFSPGLNIFMLMMLQHDLARRFGFHRTFEIAQAIFFPFFLFKKMSDPEIVWQEKTDWNNENQVKSREKSDIFVLALLSFGFGLILAILEKFKILKAKKGKPTIVKEWTIDLAYAMVAATFLRLYLFELFMVPTGSMEKNMRIGDFLISSRFAYSVQLPRTPLSFPAFHNTVPLLNLPSYVDWIQFPQKKIEFSKPKRNDVVVFYFPAGDTAVMDPSNFQGHNYEQLLRSTSVEIAQSLGDKEYWKNRKKYIDLAREHFKTRFGIIYRPVDKRENYVKRCVGLPGDSLSIVQGKILINGKPTIELENIQFRYQVLSKEKLNLDLLKEKLDIYARDVEALGKNGAYFEYEILLTARDASVLSTWNAVVKVQPNIEENFSVYEDKTLFTFPNVKNFPDAQTHWNIDNMGPIYLPKKGDQIELNPHNVVLYRRAIENYEGHLLTEKNGQYFVDGNKQTHYTFQMNYYWMMGDNRHNSADSRNWGYVPEDHIGGKPWLILFSKDPEKNWFTGLRWHRFLKLVKND